jgi:hypothetical protein
VSKAATRSRRTKAVDAATLGSATAFFARQRTIAAQPAQDDQLSDIWPPWNALPAGTQPETRRSILTGEYVDRNPEHRNELNRLCAKFSCLPFDKDVFNQALAKAVKWSTLVGFSETTFRLHRETVEQQLVFSNFDDVLGTSKVSAAPFASGVSKPQ